MSEYEIHTVEDNPREWNGPNGTVYYINVGVKGHDKLISVGKKSPDALKVGDKIYGTIQETEYPTDKFKAEQNPNFAGKPAYSGPKKSGFSPAERAKQADGQRQGMCINNAANYVVAAGGDTLKADEWAETVFRYAQALYSLGDLKASTEAPEQPQTALDTLANEG